jgi:DNA-binding MarR family transcriptional regulator
VRGRATRRTSSRGNGIGAGGDTLTATAAADDTAQPPGDYVDSLMDSWRRDLPESEVQLMGLTLRLARLDSYGHRSAVRQARTIGLSRVEAYILDALRAVGPPYQLAAGRISGRMLSNSRNISVPLRKLEERGLIRRDFDPSDRRSVLVSLTPEGISTLDQCGTSQGEIFSGLSAAEQTDLSDLLRKALISLGDTPDALREAWTREAEPQD